MKIAQAVGPADVEAGDVAEHNLTQFEYLALNSTLNIADGHARQGLTAGHARIIDDLPAMFRSAAAAPVEVLEERAYRTYFRMLGQHSHPAGGTRVLSCYSSSVAMEIFSRALATRADAVALIHPTFDNIPDLLSGCGLKLFPVEEDALHQGDLDENLLRSVGCVFITTPNNPTGRVLSEARLARLAEECREHDIVLALDTSFRGFDTRAHYDHYAVLEASGSRWCVIEDTGKLWPTLDLKVGWLVSGETVGLPIAKIYSDILLGVSPLVLEMVHRFAEDGIAGGLGELHRFIAGNRQLVRDRVAGLPGVHIADPDSRASVERLHLGHRTGLEVWSALRERNVFALPCTKFHWANPGEGEHSMRIALARSRAPLATAADAFRSVLAGV
ncbi:enduracididine biosynthesis enzyme MppP [Amycolatopsis sp.]|uniref:enduracididine biosynthesis enzyme MppP n=1 Tax=Amycolatopsis sp. TaxID=37632 RepID=UPI002D803B1B|nr:enduracididine biosynthesis enzyme MppP [Amycolatopsis sp.]HET6708336.1 enduracididine biosynthesis enzyme MppP [Amycolatopsis sp.]